MVKIILLSAVAAILLCVVDQAFACDDVIGRACDETSNRCPETFTCQGGTCGCRKDQIHSANYCQCRIRAGNIGCMIAAQCMDGAYCRHPRKKDGVRQWSFCACCSGPEEGNDGYCPPDDCQKYRM